MIQKTVLGSDNNSPAFGARQLLKAFKAAGEETRLRILVLLEKGELNVGDLAHILEQSQPRISRHLRLLDEAGLIERFREGSFVYCRLAHNNVTGALIGGIMQHIDLNDELLANDCERAARLQRQKIKSSQQWFQNNAARWDEIRSLYICDDDVERAMLALLSGADRNRKFDLLLDFGTGTGRALELLAPRVKQAIGIDSSHSMLEYARLRLNGKGLEHCQVRQGDVTELGYEDGTADLVLLHQVLHYLVEPQRAVREAGRLLQTGGQLLIVDFAPHDLDFFREEFAHERLGFSDEQIRGWLTQAGLETIHTERLAATRGMNQQELAVCLWLAEKNRTIKLI